MVEANKNQLNHLANYGNHQGVVLEANHLTKRTVTALGVVSDNNEYQVSFKRNYPPLESEKEWKGPLRENGARPLWIALDEVTDPAVMGEILRSAAYFGVDGIIVRAKNSIPVSAAVAMHSAGASEVQPIYTADSLVKFLQASQGNGWHVTGARVSYGAKRNRPIYRWPSTGAEDPTILVLGNSADGVSIQTRRKCDSLIQVPPLSRIQSNVDSLDGGVFAGIVMARLLAGRLSQHTDVQE
ncbi:hypothetical protein BGX28_006567 [Mortierella sp. GBA30]|nr:hypothetical protein BGX28_006567 [Mortierella sp. GBA30]